MTNFWIGYTAGAATVIFFVWILVRHLNKKAEEEMQMNKVKYEAELKKSLDMAYRAGMQESFKVFSAAYGKGASHVKLHSPNKPEAGSAG